MSANTYVAVQRRDDRWYVWTTSADEQDPSPPANAETRKTRADALIAAHDIHNQSGLIEYGVQELVDFVSASSYSETQAEISRLEQRLAILKGAQRDEYSAMGTYELVRLSAQQGYDPRVEFFEAAQQREAAIKYLRSRKPVRRG